MRAFITGLDGFAGQWLARQLIRNGDEVAGGSRSETPSYTVVLPEEASSLRWFPFTLPDDDRLGQALAEWRPSAVFHLAAQAFVGDALADPGGAARINVDGTATVIDAIRHHAPNARMLYVGSADAYGTVTAADLPLNESAPLRPANPYAQSKAAGEALALASKLDVVVTRSFNHTGPGQRTVFAVPSFARQIADIASGKTKPPLRVGNLDARRDYSDVRDVARAYRLLMERGERGAVYNVCTGASIAMRDVVNMLMEIAGVAPVIQVDPARLRPADSPDIVGDNAKLRAATGWEPAIPLLNTLRDVYTWCAQVPISPREN